MFRSNLKSQIILLSTALVLGGCWKPAKKDDPHNGKSERDATASFFVRNIKCETVTPQVTDKVWKVADHKEIFARACITDRKVSKEVKGHKFTVEFTENNTRETGLVTDDEGCFQWSEKIAYNPLAEKSGYIEVRRRIYGEGVHVGFRDVRLEINPWAGERGIDKQLACVYTKTGQVSASQKIDPKTTQLALQGKTGASKLWMGDIATHITLTNERDDALRAKLDKYQNRRAGAGEPKMKAAANEEGALLEVLLSMKPQVLVRGVDGKSEEINLKDGQFKVWVQLIAANVGENRDQTLLLTPNLIPGDGKIIAGKLESAIRMGLSRRVTRGRLEMAIKVVPVGLKFEVEPFESLYVIGNIENILGGFRPRLSPQTYEGSTPFSYEKYISAAENFEELKSDQLAMKFEPFIFETATVMFAGIRPGETATKRTVEYKVQTCILDTLTGRRVLNQKFKVYDENNKELEVAKGNGVDTPSGTNQVGCLIWNSSLTHKYYKPEEFFFPKFKIVHPNSGYTKIKELVLNPWDAMFRTFGFDRIEFTKEFISAVKTRTKIESRLFIPSYSYHAIRFRYEIDRFMELEVKKQILLHLRPDVLRYSGIIGGRKVTESLRDGIYLMKVAIQKDYLDPTDKGYFLMPGRDNQGKMTTKVNGRATNKMVPKHFVTVVKKLVRVNSGEINTPVEFAMRDLRLMRIRSQFLVQLEPVDEQLLLVAKVLSREDKKKIEDLERTREMTDEARHQLMNQKREALQRNLIKIRAKLANSKTGMIDENNFAQLTTAEMQEFNLTPEIVEEVKQHLQTNDFTVQAAAPVVNLDTLIEKDSGLDRRTFVGPIIFLSNAYGDDLRPTNNLDEKYCDVSDCDEIKTREIEGRRMRNNYDTSKYFGSVAYLADVQVDDLIAEYHRAREEYKRIMPKIAAVANFAEIYNLGFISLGNEKIKKFEWGCVGDEARCERPATGIQLEVDPLIQAMNSPQGELGQFDKIQQLYLENMVPRYYWPKLDILRPVTRQDLMNVPKERKISKALGERLCRLYALSVSEAVMAGFKDQTLTNVYQNCLSPLLNKETAQNGPFLMDHKLRVYETGEYVYKGGKQMNLNVGSNFGLTHNTSFGTSYGAGFDFIDIPMIGGVGAWTKPFSMKLGVGGGAGRAQSDGTSISESTYLVMQAASFAIQLKEYERCTIVKVNPRLGKAASLYLNKDKESEAKFYQAMHRGLFICTGEHETKPLPVTESYFYFTQHFTEGDMLDQADLYNHPWLLAMRGVRDFSTFVHLIMAQEFSLFEPFTKIVSKPGWPLDQMVEAYRQVLPTFPGIYTILKPGEALQEFPFDQDAEASFR